MKKSTIGIEERLRDMSLRRAIKALDKRLRALPSAYQWRAGGYAVGLQEKYFQCHKGESCIIIANGPSLNKIDIQNVGKLRTFSMNRAYLAFDDWGFVPDYHVCINELVLKQFVKEIENIPTKKFLNFSQSKHYEGKNVAFLRMHLGLHDRVVDDFYSPFSSAATVTFVCLQLALLMGFKKIGIVGLDHSFSGPGKVNQTLTSEETDENHFLKNYFSGGVLWEYPDLVRNERGYQLIREYAEKRNVDIVDCSVSGKCKMFRKGNLEKEFNLS